MRAATYCLLAALLTGATFPEMTAWPGRPGLFVWDEHASASYFVIGVWNDGGSADPIRELETPIGSEPTTETVLAGLPAGRYIFRLKAVDSHGRRSDWSEPSNVVVWLDSPAPPPPTGFGCTLFR